MDGTGRLPTSVRRANREKLTMRVSDFIDKFTVGSPWAGFAVLFTVMVVGIYFVVTLLGVPTCLFSGFWKQEITTLEEIRDRLVELSSKAEASVRLSDVTQMNETDQKELTYLTNTVRQLDRLLEETSILIGITKSIYEKMCVPTSRVAPETR